MAVLSLTQTCHQNRHKILQKLKQIDILAHLPHLTLSPVQLGSEAPRLRNFSAPEHNAAWDIHLACDIEMEGVSRVTVYGHRPPVNEDDEKDPDKKSANLGGFDGNFVREWVEGFLGRASIQVELNLIRGQLLLNIPHSSGMGWRDKWDFQIC